MLNPDQHLCVNAEGHIMVVALPGSGKTEVSVRYAERVLTDSEQHAIAMLTFTDAAATNLKRRLKSTMPRSQTLRVFPSTFHSMAVQLWRQTNSYKTIVMGGHLNIYIERAMRACHVAMSYEEAEKTISTIGQYLTIPRSEFSSIKLKLFAAYESIMRKEGKVDLNQISRDVIHGLRDGTIRPLSETLGVTHICADEFQDSDDLQYMFLYEHAKRGCCIMVVGDDDQSIYAFRNARGVDNFRNMQADLNAKAYSLKICYRCPPAILNVANNLIQHNVERIPKELRSHVEEGGVVDCHGFKDEDHQVESVVEGILADQGGWAVLARTNKEIDTVELELSKHKVKVKRLGGKSFFESADVICYIKLMWMLTHRNSRYLQDFLAYMHEDEVMIDMAKSAKSNGIDFIGTVTTLTQSQSLLIHTQSIFEMFMHEGVPKEPSKTVNAEYQRKIISMVMAQRNMNSPAALGAMADILTKTAASLGSLAKAADQFHDRITKINAKKAEKIGTDEVVIATLHGSKGLEFPKVAILSCQDERIPQPDKDGLGEKHWEEERRLLYVGITRAEKYLRLCFFKEQLSFLREAVPDRIELAVQQRNEEPDSAAQAEKLQQLKNEFLNAS
ncbi:ATP-dependent helicase [Vibrio sp. 10N.222.51.C8]|jgi:superfamily I DNA/RNA helicase|uniref:DNA 3'-5' helicase n=2 Tax=Vibrio cyclitrophicus TaxID=47951 RepID=A0A7Z1MHT8_9VIBR|nr:MULTISPECIES: ATP-dependent helicase [Vibrio]PMM25253.1 hypothetical protein BCT58_00410 [Vibrio lentus]PMM78692.1 hypothetical protein BCT48_00030 [Vibrio sp. 10N.261.46.F12]PMP24535.1 hypothetical protein BCS91_13580 [Vibrio cyclitrophicus]PMP28128.1 hypothetical protein BCS90_20005 [Vibrio cyclitrophicus]TKG10481.1 ATP-dependent helicase [Vibrio sp. F13]